MSDARPAAPPFGSDPRHRHAAALDAALRPIMERYLGTREHAACEPIPPHESPAPHETPRTRAKRRRHPRRFWEKVAIDDGCWEWCGAKDEHGYGLYWLDGKSRRAHVVAFTLLRGPMPEGTEPDHSCRNPGCVRPGHMEPVTHRTNVLRGVSPPAANALKTECRHGHRLTPTNTYVKPNGWRICRTCRRAEEQSRYRRLKSQATGQ
jgi:hypothetical protein